VANRINWRGKQVSRRVMSATAKAINDTMADAVRGTVGHHPGWQNRTFTAEGSVRVVSAAAIEGAMIVGRWGSIGVRYAIFLEMLHGPWLRASGDREYPKLASRIRANLR